MDSINPIRLYTVPEVADMLGVSHLAVRNLISSDQLRAKRFHTNAHPRVPGQSVIDYLDTRKAGCA